MLVNLSPFVLDWRNALGLTLSVLVALISGPGQCSSSSHGAFIVFVGLRLEYQWQAISEDTCIGTPLLRTTGLAQYCSAAATAGGQGGGSFYVVIFSVLLGFSTNQASVLTAGVVFLG